MNQTQIATAVGIVTIVVLGYKLKSIQRRANELVDKHNKLVAWSQTARKLLQETASENPERIRNLSSDLTTDINFYNIMEAENLL
jgi:hypothetical protein